MKRVWISIDLWEEIPAGMWCHVKDRSAMLQAAIAFTGDHVSYGAFMQRVIREWPNSCLNALTDQNLNQRAWIGHAACAMAICCPEDITRQAWSCLTHEQRTLANKEADRAIRYWRQCYRSGRDLCPDVERPMLFGRDPSGSTQGDSGSKPRPIMEGYSHCLVEKRS